MATIDEINQGMSFEELLVSSSDLSDSSYSSLLTDLIDQIELATTPGVTSEVNTLMEQLMESVNEDEQHLIANAICDKLNQFVQAIDTVIDSDLSSQQITRQDLANLNIAASLLPPETIRNTVLFNTIATDSFKQIVADN